MTALIILAAGASSRLGQPKQNIIFRDKTLLQHAIEVALQTSCKPIVVVLGANATVIHPSIINNEVILVQNNEWPEGMASSIRSGINAAYKAIPELSAAIIMLCDQPYITPALLTQLIQQQKVTGKKIIACSYNNTIGAPALFHQSLFPDLLSLKGTEGAKKIFMVYPNEVLSISFPSGAIDIDTPDDVAALHNIQKEL
jgi:molybdenum cofactor cytidylyltransferase